MIRINEDIWIGDSADERRADLRSARIDAILNVAQDLRATRGWSNEIEYMQVGLIDGPGNPMAGYCAAVLALETLLDRGKVLVCCHNGGRSLAVVLMYLHLVGGQGWGGILDVLREHVDARLPDPHAAHRAMFDEIDWKLLRRIVG